MKRTFRAANNHEGSRALVLAPTGTVVTDPTGDTPTEPHHVIVARLDRLACR